MGAKTRIPPAAAFQNGGAATTTMARRNPFAPLEPGSSNDTAPRGQAADCDFATSKASGGYTGASSGTKAVLVGREQHDQRRCRSESEDASMGRGRGGHAHTRSRYNEHKKAAKSKSKSRSRKRRRSSHRRRRSPSSSSTGWVRKMLKSAFRKR